jgi:ABC-type antimicrobial peptide transport system permease subunit
VIVGVVRDVPHNGVEDRSNTPFIYYPMLRATPDQLCFMVRSPRPIGDLVSAIRAKLRDIDPTIPIFETRMLKTAVDESYFDRRAIMLVLGGFAALALFLSAIGIYGVLAYDVSQRTREIGIRGAIGASRQQIVGMVMRQGLVKTAAGIGIGLIASALLGRIMAGMLFELKPTDPWAYLCVSLLLAAVAGLASYIPAHRAAGIDPVQALRME